MSCQASTPGWRRAVWAGRCVWAGTRETASTRTPPPCGPVQTPGECSTVQYSAVQYSAVQYSAVQCSTVLLSTTSDPNLRMSPVNISVISLSVPALLSLVAKFSPLYKRCLSCYLMLLTKVPLLLPVSTSMNLPSSYSSMACAFERTLQSK